jgi:osmotically-inducible protein OsmY
MDTPRVMALLLAATVSVGGCSMVSGRSTGQVVNDVSLTTQVKSRLAATEGLATLTRISVSTHDDWVTLEGTVADEATLRRIDRLVRGLAGDNRVVNHLQVEGAPSAAARTR